MEKMYRVVTMPGPSGYGVREVATVAASCKVEAIRKVAEKLPDWSKSVPWLKGFRSTDALDAVEVKGG